MPDLTDRVRRAQDGDETAFRELYDEHAGRIYALCLRLTGDAATAQERTQDAFVRAWERLRSFRGDSAFGTWLHRLAVNVVLGRRKTLGVERGRYHTGEDALDGVSGRRETPEMTMDFEEAISRLPDGARQVFVLHDVEGFRHEEIARMLGVVPGTSKSQLHHARMALRRYLDK